MEKLDFSLAETMKPAVVRRFKGKSIERSGAMFAWM